MVATPFVAAKFEKTEERPLHEQVRDFVRQQCLEAQPDVALPPLRQLSEMWGVHHVTISRAFRELEAEGLLRIVPGKGTFVVRAAPDHLSIELVTLQTHTQDLLDTPQQMFKGFQQGLPAEFSLYGRTILVPPVPNVDLFLQETRMRNINGLAIFGFGYLSHHEALQEAQLIYQLSEQMPVVLAGKEHNLLNIDAVFCDPVPQMNAFLQGCYADGLRRFEYFGINNAHLHLQHRLDSFRAFLLSHSLSWQPPLEHSDSLAEVRRLLALKPQVIVASCPYSAQQVVIEAQGCGIALGSDLHVLCFAGSPAQVRAITPYVSVILLEEEEVGRCVAKRLHNRLLNVDKAPPIVRRIPGRLVRQGQKLPPM